MNIPKRTDFLAGSPELLAALVSNYRCGHCTGEVTELVTTEAGLMHASIEHDAGCPVLNGVLSSVPDTLRAAQSAVPATFRR